jgi:hypothetical protein
MGYVTQRMLEFELNALVECTDLSLQIHEYSAGDGSTRYVLVDTADNEELSRYLSGVEMYHALSLARNLYHKSHVAKLKKSQQQQKEQEQEEGKLEIEI